MERREMVDEILSRVMQKLSEAGESVSGIEEMPDQSLNDAGSASLPGVLILTQKHGEVCHGMLESTALKAKFRTACALAEDYQINIEDFEAVVLYNFSIDAMSKLSSGITDTPYTKLAAQALLMGKKLYVPKEEVELCRYPEGEAGSYRCMLEAKLKKLVTFGLVICPLDEIEGRLLGEEVQTKPCPVREEKASSAAHSEAEPLKEICFQKKVITERDVIEANREGVKVIRLHSKNILTALAKDAASSRNIRLIRE